MDVYKIIAVFGSNRGTVVREYYCYGRDAMNSYNRLLKGLNLWDRIVLEKSCVTIRPVSKK